MDGLTAIVVAVITTAGTLGVAYLGARRLGARERPEPGQGSTQTQLREMLDIQLAESSIWKTKYETATREHTAEVAVLRTEIDTLTRRLELTQHDADECSRRIDDLYSKLRADGRLADRRARRRPEA